MKLFERGKIGTLELKNRIIVAPNGIRGEANPDGNLSDRAIDRYVSYARGGAGMITVGHLHVENEVESHLDGVWSNKPRIDSAVYKLQWGILADAVHDYGAKLAVHLSAGFGRMAYPDTVSTNEVVAPSSQPCYWNPKITARELTLDEIGRLIDAMGAAALRLKSVGVDAVDLHASAGHLIDQFLSGIWNKRTDAYGGSTAGRARFLIDIVAKIKACCGQDFPVTVRMSLKNYIEGGRDFEESFEIMKLLEQNGVNAIHAAAGCYEYRRFQNPSTYQPAGVSVRFAELAKSAVSIPVITFGKLGDPELAEKVLSEGKADFIALARPFLADSEWPNKAKAGKWDDIRPCIGCHDGCLQRSLENKYVTCAVNPAAGMERALALSPAEQTKRVLVVGGGPGGMEAARVAALRGHRVTLLEKNSRLGGALLTASVPDFKQDLRTLIRYQSKQLANLGVDVRLGVEATPEIVKEYSPDAVFVATGASPVIPRIPGIEHAVTRRRSASGGENRGVVRRDYRRRRGGLRDGRISCGRGRGGDRGGNGAPACGRPERDEQKRAHDYAQRPRRNDAHGYDGIGNHGGRRRRQRQNRGGKSPESRRRRHSGRDETAERARESAGRRGPRTVSDRRLRKSPQDHERNLGRLPPRKTRVKTFKGEGFNSPRLL